MATLILRDGRWFNKEVPYQYVEKINGYPIYVNSKWMHVEDVNPGFKFKCPDCGFKIGDRWKIPYYERCPGCGNNMGQLLTDKDNFVDIGDILVPEPPKIYMNEFYYDDLIKIEQNAYKQFEKHSLVTIFIKFNNGEEFKYDVVALEFELFNDKDNFIHFITNDGNNYIVRMSEVLSFRTNAAGAL